MADEDCRARYPPERAEHAVDITGVAVEAVLAGDHLVALGPQRAHDLVEARTIGPQPVGEHDDGVVLLGHVALLSVEPLSRADPDSGHDYAYLRERVHRMPR